MDRSKRFQFAPFPWFGGKRRIADVVWQAFGPDIPNFVEPFFGSGAILLGRPNGAGKIETVNDLDRYLANFFRAVQADPDAVANHADWPVNEADLHARHNWLTRQAEFRVRMHADPDFYDVKIAGWWVWGICAWIGGGWCFEPRNRKRPQLYGIGKGVHSDAGHATPMQSRQLPMLRVDSGAGGAGIHASGFLSQAYSHGLPSLGNDRGIHGVAAAPCVTWFRTLQSRLRRVRVACGDWTRVLGPSTLGFGKNVGGRRPCAVFLDPPYERGLRTDGIYNEDERGISAGVRQWALEHGDKPELRIALCGYEGEHEMPDRWRCHTWKGARGYAGDENENASKERVWFSPHCLKPVIQHSLF